MPVQVLNKTIRDDIYQRTLAAVRQHVAPDADPDDPTPLIGQCLEFAWFGYQLIRDWPGAPRTLIQAGSAQWPRVPPAFDDGVSPTHFAYEWDPQSAFARLVRSGTVPVARRADGHLAPSLPEIHVWLGCPDTGEIIDFTTGSWPAACRVTLGHDWLAPLPPPYFWNFGTRRPDGVNYVPDRDAIDCVIELLRLQGREYP